MGCDDCEQANDVAYCTMCEGFFCFDCRGVDAEHRDVLCEKCELVLGPNRDARLALLGKSGPDTACLICRESVEDKPALRCSQCPYKPIHAACATPGNDACPQCWAPLTGVFEIRTVCQHNRPHEYRKDCGGAAICQHNQLRGLCKDCGGVWICQHNRIRPTCKDCCTLGHGGAAICEHNAIRRMCWECHRFRLQ